MRLGGHHTEAAREKMSRALKDPAVRAKISATTSAANRLRVISPETRAKLRAARRGRPIRTTHGLTRRGDRRTFASWNAMMMRCYDPTHLNYKNYGGRTPERGGAVLVCELWCQSPAAFANDMGLRPLGKTLDRIDNAQGYYKENCRWATMEEQHANRRPRALAR